MHSGCHRKPSEERHKGYFTTIAAKGTTRNPKNEFPADDTKLQQQGRLTAQTLIQHQSKQKQNKKETIKSKQQKIIQKGI